MHFRVLIAVMILIGSCALDRDSVEAQEKQTKQATKSETDPKAAGPVVETGQPKSGSVDSFIHLSGFRLHPWHKMKAFFIQGGAEFPALTAGGSFITNNEHNVPQSLTVVVPDGVRPGVAQLVIEFEGRRSSPVTVTITEWKLPIVNRLDPASGAPGTFVRVEGEGFHATDELEITDTKGTLIKLDSSFSSDGTSFRIPQDSVEGTVSVRVGSKHGKGQYTRPLVFTVTNEPLPVELDGSDTRPVAPGQWLDLQISNIEPLKRSHRTEVAFKQAGKTIIVALPKPFRPHVAVPRELAAGEVEVQLRTWRGDKPSQWSEPTTVELADKPVAPLIDTIKVVNGKFASLSPGPDRATSFTVSPGDEVALNGLWPVADANKLKVSLVRAGEVISMTATEVDDKYNWFGAIQVRLPESLSLGDWRMIVSSEADGTQSELPIVIRVVKKLR
jgi:hypothetical protein